MSYLKTRMEENDPALYGHVLTTIWPGAAYYGDARFPEGLVKKYPDGRKQLVSVNANGEVSVIRDI